MLDQLEELLDHRLQHLGVRGHVLSIKTDILLILAQMAHWSTYHLIEPQAMIASTVVAIEVAFLRLWETILLLPHQGHLRPRDLLFPQRGTMLGRRGCQSHMLAKVCHRNMYKNNSLYCQLIFESQIIQTLRHKSYFFPVFFPTNKNIQSCKVNGSGPNSARSTSYQAKTSKGSNVSVPSKSNFVNAQGSSLQSSYGKISYLRK